MANCPTAKILEPFNIFWRNDEKKKKYNQITMHAKQVAPTSGDSYNHG